MAEMKSRTGNGQSQCKRCKELGKWNVSWDSLMYDVFIDFEWNGPYCYECAKEISLHTSDFKIIENSEEARRDFGYNCGVDYFTITKADIEALMSGKCLAVEENGGEYSAFIILEGNKYDWEDKE